MQRSAIQPSAPGLARPGRPLQSSRWPVRRRSAGRFPPRASLVAGLFGLLFGEWVVWRTRRFCLDPRPHHPDRAGRHRGAADLELVAAAPAAGICRARLRSATDVARRDDKSRRRRAGAPQPSGPSDQIGIVPADYDTFEHLLDGIQAAYSKEDLQRACARAGNAPA